MSPQSNPVFISVEPETRAAIVDALYRFGAGQDLSDAALFKSAFSADASLDFTGPARRLGVSLPVFDGRQTIVEGIMASTADLDTTHIVTNPRILDYQGDRASLFAIVEAQHLPKGNHGTHLLLKNFYFVDLVLEAGEWRIARMRIENVWMTGDPAVLFPPAQGGSAPA